jgi:hypothetical protein
MQGSFDARKRGLFSPSRALWGIIESKEMFNCHQISHD